VNENIESKPVKQKEVVALRQTPSSSNMMEIESEHSDFESDIKIKKKMRPKKAIKSVSISQINNKKRRTPVIPPPQSNSNITYDSSNLPLRDDTKKIKKTVLRKISSLWNKINF